MKKATTIFLLLYYSFAIVVFPMCDFSMMKDLPEMYKHCKATEDPNLTVLDFFTEHLVDFDKIFEEDEKGEKPHQTQMSHSITCYVGVVTTQQILIQKKSQHFIPIRKNYCNYQNNYSFTYHTEILHPPIV